MKLIYCLLLLLCPYSNHAQTLKEALSIGDGMPLVVSETVFNYKGTAINMAAFKGKLLILDFMRTTCPSCLEKIALFHQLQQEFAAELQFVIVSSEPAARIKKFLQSHRLGKQISLPFIANDSMLKALFPYEYISHLVWIGPDGIVKAITHGEYVTAANIRSVLKGEPNNWPVKKDVPDFDYQKPLLAVNPQVAQIAAVQPLTSIFLPYIPEVGGRNILYAPDSIQHTVRTAFYNRPITELYLGLYGKSWFPRTQIVLQVKDSSRYIRDETNTYWHEWMQQNSYCYECILPESMGLQQQQQRISSELDFYLGIHARMEEREMPCLLLKRTKATLPATDTGSESFSLATVVYELNRVYSGMPVFIDDEQEAQVRLPVARALLRNRAALEPILQAAGYALIPVMRKVELLLITEPNFIIKQTN